MSMNNGSTELGPEIKMENPKITKNWQSASDGSSALIRTHHSLGVQAEVEWEETEPRMKADIQVDACETDGSGCDAWLSVRILLKVTKQSLPVKGIFKITAAAASPADDVEDCQASQTGEQLARTDTLEAEDDDGITPLESIVKLEGELLPPPHEVEWMTDISRRPIDEQMKLITSLQEVGEGQIQDDFHLEDLNGPFEDAMSSIFASANTAETAGSDCETEEYNISDVETHSEPGTVELSKLPDSPRHSGNSAEATCELKTMQCSENTTFTTDVGMQRNMSVRIPKLDVTQNMKITVTTDMAGINQSEKQHICVEHNGAKLFSCTDCGLKFDDETNILRHTLSCKGCSNKTNDAAQPYPSLKKLLSKEVTGENSGDFIKSLSKNLQCEMCGNHFDRYNLEWHQFIHKGADRLKCRWCSDTFAYTCRRRLHEITHFPEELSGAGHNNTFWCNICGTVCRNVQDLRLHLRPYEGDKLLKCRFCAETFSRSCQHKLHEIDHFKDKIPGAAEAERNKTNLKYCSICEEMFEEFAALQSHILKVHHKHKGVPISRPITILKCKQCPYTDVNDKSFQWHINIHADSNAFTCKVCGTAFDTLANLHHHTLIVHSAEWECKVCGKMFKTKLKLSGHSQSHNKKHKCNICDYSGSGPSRLKLHVRLVHMGEKRERRFPCSLCSYIAQSKFMLKQHATRIHSDGTGDVPHVICDQCGCKLYGVNSLSRHKLKHTGQQKHVCKTCNKSFLQKGSLNRHMDAHMGVKRFKCEVCDASFSQSFPLTKHLQKKHPDYFDNLVTSGKYKGKRGPWVAHCQDNSGSNSQLSTTSVESRTEANTSNAGE